MGKNGIILWDGEVYEDSNELLNFGEHSSPVEDIFPPPADLAFPPPVTVAFLPLVVLISQCTVILAFPPPSEGFNSTLPKKTVMASPEVVAI